MSIEKKKIVWNIYKEGDIYLLVPNPYVPIDYVKLNPCPECEHPHYKPIKLYLIGKWVGDFTEETGRFFRGIMGEHATSGENPQ